MGIKSNNSSEEYYNYFGASGLDAAGQWIAPVPPSGVDASGGVISDYTTPTGTFRAHIFNGPGTFVVSSLSDEPTNYPDNASILLVGGGAGGASGPGWGGGGGGGGYLETTTFPLAAQTYPVAVGKGGLKGNNPAVNGINGTDTIFTNPTAPKAYTAMGGGGGSRTGAGLAGGNPGGPGENHGPSPTTVQQPDSPFTGYGYLGGHPSGPNTDVGGGGSGGNATSISAKYPGRTLPTNSSPGGPVTRDNPNTVGGVGRPNNFAYGPTNALYYSGGGGGGNNDWDARPPYGGSGTFDPTAPTNYRPYGSPPTAMNTAPAGGSGGAGNNYWALMPEIQRAGLMGRGGGGGGGLENGGQYDPGQPGQGDGWPGYGHPADGGNGGDGCCIIKYQIATTQTQTASATGGAISHYGGKTIHAFLESGTFTTNAGFNKTVEYVVLAGGGGGSNGGYAGGGGAGGYLTGTQAINTPTSTPMAITVGRGGAGGVEQAHNEPKAIPGVPGENSVAAFPSAITATGGGGGGTGNSGPGGSAGNEPGENGGSGGGGGSYGSANPTPGGEGGGAEGNDGGAGGSQVGGGGGGGAGGVGGDGGGPHPNPAGGHGGLAIKIPSTFHGSNFGYAGPTGSYFYVAGGGGGCGAGSAGNGGGPTAPTDENGWGGAGYGAKYPHGPSPTNHNAGNARTNSGSGGGGGAFNNDGGVSPGTRGASGGPGIVLIAYPT